MGGRLVSSPLIEALSGAARNSVPLTVRIATTAGTRELRDVVVSSVGIGGAVVRPRSGGRCVAIAFSSVIAVERLDGRPFRPKARPPADDRRAVEARAEALVDAGGIE